jgi:hypothetical protein
VEVGQPSAFAKMVPADQVENSARQQYYQMLDRPMLKKRSLPKTIRS